MYTLGWNTSKYNGEDVINFLNGILIKGVERKWWLKATIDQHVGVINVAESKARESKVRYKRRARKGGEVLYLTDPSLCKSSNMTALTDLLSDDCPQEIRDGLIEVIGMHHPDYGCNFYEVYNGSVRGYKEAYESGEADMKEAMKDYKIRTGRSDSSEKAKKKALEAEIALKEMHRWDRSCVHRLMTNVRSDVSWWSHRGEPTTRFLQQYLEYVNDVAKYMDKQHPNPERNSLDHVQGILKPIPLDKAERLIELIRLTGEAAREVANCLEREEAE